MNTPPLLEGQRTERNGHLVVGVEGELPANDLVWECQDCSLRGTELDVFDREDCDGGEQA